MPDPPALGLLSKKAATAIPVELLFRLGAVSWNPAAAKLNRVEVERVHGAGCFVLPWTVTTQKEWNRILEIGADGAFSNEFFDEKGR